MQTGVFILISISVWEDKNDEWWFRSYRFHKSDSYSGDVLLISSYFIRSTNHCHSHHTWRPPPSVYVLEPIPKVTSSIWRETANIWVTGRQNVQSIYQAESKRNSWLDSRLYQIILFPSFPSSPYDASWPRWKEDNSKFKFLRKHQTIFSTEATEWTF